MKDTISQKIIYMNLISSSDSLSDEMLEDQRIIKEASKKNNIGFYQLDYDNLKSFNMNEKNIAFSKDITPSSDEETFIINCHGGIKKNEERDEKFYLGRENIDISTGVFDNLARLIKDRNVKKVNLLIYSCYGVRLIIDDKLVKNLSNNIGDCELNIYTEPFNYPTLTTEAKLSIVFNSSSIDLDSSIDKLGFYKAKYQRGACTLELTKEMLAISSVLSLSRSFIKSFVGESVLLNESQYELNKLKDERSTLQIKLTSLNKKDFFSLFANKKEHQRKINELEDAAEGIDKSIESLREKFYEHREQIMNARTLTYGKLNKEIDVLKKSVGIDSNILNNLSSKIENCNRHNVINKLIEDKHLCLMRSLLFKVVKVVIKLKELQNKPKETLRENLMLHINNIKGEVVLDELTTQHKIFADCISKTSSTSAKPLDKILSSIGNSKDLFSHNMIFSAIKVLESHNIHLNIDEDLKSLMNPNLTFRDIDERKYIKPIFDINEIQNLRSILSHLQKNREMENIINTNKLGIDRRMFSRSIDNNSHPKTFNTNSLSWKDKIRSKSLPTNQAQGK